MYTYAHTCTCTCNEAFHSLSEHGEGDVARIIRVHRFNQRVNLLQNEKHKLNLAVGSQIDIAKILNWQGHAQGLNARLITLKNWQMAWVMRPVYSVSVIRSHLGMSQWNHTAYWHLIQLNSSPIFFHGKFVLCGQACRHYHNNSHGCQEWPNYQWQCSTNNIPEYCKHNCTSQLCIGFTISTYMYSFCG